MSVDQCQILVSFIAFTTPSPHSIISQPFIVSVTLSGTCRANGNLRRSAAVRFELNELSRKHARFHRMLPVHRSYECALLFHFFQNLLIFLTHKYMGAFNLLLQNGQANLVITIRRHCILSNYSIQVSKILNLKFEKQSHKFSDTAGDSICNGCIQSCRFSKN